MSDNENETIGIKPIIFVLLSGIEWIWKDFLRILKLSYFRQRQRQLNGSYYAYGVELHHTKSKIVSGNQQITTIYRQTYK